MPMFDLRPACSLDPGALATVLLLPGLAGFAAGGILVLGGAGASSPGGWSVFVLAMMKLCYLGTAAAHLGRFIAEGAGADPDDAGARWGDAAEEERAAAAALWRAFPNPLDACLLATVMTLVLHRLG